MVQRLNGSLVCETYRSSSLLALIRCSNSPQKSISHSLCHPSNLPRHPTRGLWQTALIQRRPMPFVPTGFPLLPVDRLIERFQHHSTPRHHQRTHSKEPNPALRTYHVKYRIGVESVMPRARFHPRPVQKGENGGQGERLRCGDGPGRREEQQVEGEQGTGDGVKAEISH